MLEPSWESHLTTLSNLPTPTFLTSLSEFITSQKIDLTRPSTVYYGRDTRASGVELKEALEAGLRCCEAKGRANAEGAGEEGVQGWGETEWVDMGVVTTPTVHHAVRGRNLKGTEEERERYGGLDEDGYLRKMAGAFEGLMVSLNHRGVMMIIVPGLQN